MKIVLENAVARFPEFRFREPLFWEMEEGESWAVVGPNGAGKTLFTDFLQGSVSLKEGTVRYSEEQGSPAFSRIRTLVFRDIYSVNGAGSMYYQQRWNSRDAEESPMSSSFFDGFDYEKIQEYSSLFGIGELLEKRIISLSSGELRKFLITRALMYEPEVLILDNPFIGLDETSRRSLDGMLSELKDRKGLQTILVLSQTKDIPGWVDRIQPVRDRTLLPAMHREEFFRDPSFTEYLFKDSADEVDAGNVILPAGNPLPENDYDFVLKMKGVTVKYGGRKILEGIDWTVRKGENWALTGKNGSGKSTLLSLVCGDNPQAYANDIVLFDRKRGSGESIWDIKKRIGYLSPDVHTYYLEDIPCLKVVASGFFDSVGLSGGCSEEQYGLAAEWMKVFHAEHLADRSFVRISYGEQRLVLLVRAFVKSPELLILDEPLHGLDMGKKHLAKDIIEKYCSDPQKTLVYVSHYRDEIPSNCTLVKSL